MLALSVDGFENLLPLILRFFGRDTEVRARSRDNVMPASSLVESRFRISRNEEFTREFERISIRRGRFGARRSPVYIVGRVLIVNFDGGASLPLLDKSSYGERNSRVNIGACLHLDTKM